MSAGLARCGAALLASGILLCAGAVSASASQATALSRTAGGRVAASSRLSAAVSSSKLASTTKNTALALLSNQLASYSTEYSNGEWGDVDLSTLGCWACDEGGPTTAEATVFLLGGGTNQAQLARAVASVNAALSDHQQSDGSFTYPAGDGLSAQIETMFYGVELGTTDLLLQSYVSTATQTRWANALVAAANYEINSGATTYYSNGNINLGYTELLWLAWHASRSASLLAAYNNSLSFTVAPPQSQFPGAGWVTVTTPTATDGSDGAGYFAETGTSTTGTNATGFDPYYTMIQLDVLSRLYLLSRDTRVLRYLNMELNQELSLVNSANWNLNTSNGTRHTAAGTTENFQTSALAVLGFSAGRAGLLADVLPELQQEAGWYANGAAAEQPAFRRALGDSVATVALTAALALQSSGSQSVSTIVAANTARVKAARRAAAKAAKAKAERAAKLAAAKRRREAGRRALARRRAAQRRSLHQHARSR